MMNLCAMLPGRPSDTGSRTCIQAAVAAVVLLASVLLVAPGVALADGGTVTVSPDRGPIGTEVTVSGTLDPDCHVDSPVTVAIGAIDGWMPDPQGNVTHTVIATAEADGLAYRVTGAIPNEIGTDTPATPGSQEIHIYCYSPLSSYPWHSATGRFTMTGDDDPGEPEVPEDGVTLDVTSTTAGGSVSFRAGGFAADAEVTVDLHSDPVRLGVVPADATGAVEGTVTVPADTVPGRHTLVLTGAGSDGDTLVLRVALNIVAAATGSPTTSTPSESPPTTLAPVTPATPSRVEPRFTG